MITGHVECILRPAIEVVKKKESDQIKWECSADPVSDIIRKQQIHPQVLLRGKICKLHVQN